MIDTGKTWETANFTWAQAKSVKDELAWVNMGRVTLEQAAAKWLATLSPLTAKNYRSGLERLAKFGIVDMSQSLQACALANHNIAMERIRGKDSGLQQQNRPVSHVHLFH